MLKTIKIVLCVVFSVFCVNSNCKRNPKPNGPIPPDTLVTPKGLIKFSLIQYGDTLGTLDIYENKHNILLDKAVHVDSLLMGQEINFSFLDTAKNVNFNGVDPYVFVFIQSINTNIGYNDWYVIKPGWYGGRTKLNFDDIKDSIFYCEAFFCLFDLDNNNSGMEKLKIVTVNDDLTFKTDTIEVDASYNTVVLDSAVYLSDIIVSDSFDQVMLYRFWGEYMERESQVFLLTKYKTIGKAESHYVYDHSGIFGPYPGGQWNLYPQSNEIEYIFAFWPIFPTKYENQFWKEDYDLK